MESEVRLKDVIMSVLFVWNGLIKKLLTTKSKQLKSVFFSGQASRP